ncbi:VOC family protein [Rheinheimera salexigens]|uniref:Glyoxalase n=1 Tax=Rheinheimera salexigens TaxID=1628148 RepID=A0A1E7Q6G3_9GAMM|nr:VOC family protein [Rheinheimera salexigens]OEY69663.1 glyoxalase [Rheinheimera salexigens]
MQVGCFSISLSVKNLAVSQAFYERLGFIVFAGELAHNFLIMKNGDTNIGLFQDMFAGNILTFNPGWDQRANKLDKFTDVREIHKYLKANGVEIKQNAIKESSGPASFVISDPDGNTIMFDQHV